MHAAFTGRSVRLARALACVVLTALAVPARAEVRVPLELHNNTDATLVVELMSQQPAELYGTFTVPPVSVRRWPSALRLGYTRLVASAPYTSGRPRHERTFFHGKSTVGVSIELFPRDFRTTAMFDGGQGRRQPQDLVGHWDRADGHRVAFDSDGQGGFHGRIEVLTEHMASLGFVVGEETFRLVESSPGTFQGDIKWRSSDGRSWWQTVTLRLQQDTLTGAGTWQRAVVPQF